MNFKVGDLLNVDGVDYTVKGKIQYMNEKDNASWDEYLLFTPNGQECWLSVDEVYNEYSVSRVVSNASLDGYHEVDSGTEVVTGKSGQVDVDVMERAVFHEYEDSTEEMIISIERWEDGEEISAGYYLDADDIRCLHKDSSESTNYNTYNEFNYSERGEVKSNSSSTIKRIVVCVLLIVVVWILACIIQSGFFESAKISKHLKNSSYYTYTTSMTSQYKDKADIYTTDFTIAQAATDIIDAIKGDTEYVQQNTEDNDGSIAILTKKEYCLIYESDSDETMVMISSRKYAYSSYDEPYHARSAAIGRYYRRFYYSTGYTKDYSRYTKKKSAYTGFSDDYLNYNSNNFYSGYSSSVRQSSIRSRTSDSGGVSYGK